MVKSSVLRAGAAASCVFVLVLAQCGVAPPGSASSAIGAEGGRVSLTSGASVAVPAGALTQTRTITVREGAVLDALPQGAQAVGTLLVLGPEGQTFSSPVSVTLPTTAEADAVYTRPVGAAAWTLVEDTAYDAARGAIVARVQHFSEFVPVAHRRCASSSDCSFGQRCLANRCVGSAPPPSDASADTGPDATPPPPSDAGPPTPIDAGPDASPPPVDATPPGDASRSCRVDADCSVGEACVRGACEPLPCRAPLVSCDGACVSLESDVDHCGACGDRCPSGSVCRAGACLAPTDAGTPSCSADSECPAGMLCRGGLCAPGAPTDAGSPTDAGTDAEPPTDAGSSSCLADGDCPAGELCVAGVCAASPTDAGSGGCSAPHVLCGSYCADLTSDARNCGACGVYCLPGAACVAGACR